MLVRGQSFDNSATGNSAPEIRVVSCHNSRAGITLADGTQAQRITGGAYGRYTTAVAS